MYQSVPLHTIIGSIVVVELIVARVEVRYCDVEESMLQQEVCDTDHSVDQISIGG